METRAEITASDLIFKQRSREISTLVGLPEITAGLQNLPPTPRVLDLFTGTGAGVVAIANKLIGLQKTPDKIVAVDNFNPSNLTLWDSSFAPVSLNTTSEGTKQSLSKTLPNSPVTVLQEDVLEYLYKLTAEKQILPFDLITGFGIPTRERPVAKIIQFIENPVLSERFKGIAIFTLSVDFDQEDLATFKLIQRLGDIGQNWRLSEIPQAQQNGWDSYLLVNFTL